MDQDSSNDTEKRNWRERLGIGTKEMPKIAGEFAKPAEPVLVLPKSRGEAPPPVVVAKPAPMAPRVGAKPAPASRPAGNGEKPVRPPQAAPPTPGRPMQPAAPQNPDVLAERLRNQREAAEKLAEQRVNNARERAEAVKAAEPQALRPGPEPVRPQQKPASQGGAKPKFSFAEDDVRADAKREPRSAPPIRPGAAQQRPVPQAQPMQPQLSPARPPLGGDRFVTPQLPPPTRQVPPPAAKPGFGPPPQFRPQAPGGYRPIDPATGYTPPPSFQMPRGAMAPPSGPRPAAVPGSLATDPRLQSAPYSGGDTYAPPIQAGGIPRYDQMARPQAPLRGDHLRPQTHSYEGDIQDDIFEDAPQKPIRRASVNDYSQAYNPDADMDYAAPRRRSSGPIILLSLLALAAVAGIGGVLYYQNMMKPGSSTTAAGDAPVVPAPVDSTKTTAESTGGGTANTTPVAPSKKQIYDRIIGDKEVLGSQQVVPTEEAPVQPAIDQATQPAAIPVPSTGQADEPLPLPMPPPVNNTQGAAVVPQPAATAVALPPADPAPAAAPTTTVTATGYTPEQQQQLAAVSQQKAEITDPAAADATQADASQATVTDEPPAATAKPAAKPKVAAKPKPKKKVETAAKNLGAAPVVLVPEQNGAAATQDPAVTLDGEPALQPATPVVEQPVKKKKTLLGLFNGENKRIEEQGATVGASGATTGQQQQRVASVQTQSQAQPETAQTAANASGTGFTLQLASFATEQEAQSEYDRVAKRHSSIVSGLSPIISPVSVGGSTRYRLSLGTLSSSTAAQSKCKEFASAGMRDCVVRRR